MLHPRVSRVQITIFNFKLIWGHLNLYIQNQKFYFGWARPVIYLYSSSSSNLPLILLSKSSLILVGTKARPFGRSSSTRSSRLILSSPFCLMISMQCFFNSSFQPHSTSFCLRYSSNFSFSPLSSNFFSMRLFLMAMS